MAVQISPGLGASSPPTEQLIAPFVGAINTEQVTNTKKAH